MTNESESNVTGNQEEQQRETSAPLSPTPAPKELELPKPPVDASPPESIARSTESQPEPPAPPEAAPVFYPPPAAEQPPAAPAESSPVATTGLMDAALEKEIEDAMKGMGHDEMSALTGSDSDKDSKWQSARIVGIHGDDVFVDLGGKDQGLVSRSSLPEGNELVVGDILEVKMGKFNNTTGMLQCIPKGAAQDASWETLEVGTIVEGKVTGMNKGGLEVDLKGIRGFMPSSQCDVGHLKDVSVLIGETVRAEVMEYNKRDKNVLISRRKVLESERAERREAVMGELEVGQVRKGVVSSIMEYGAFIDLGGVDGLLHISDMSYGQVNKSTDVVTQGQEIEVKILKINKDRDRISLGLKQCLPDPWQGIETRYPVGEKVKARVVRLADFGAFAELEAGIDALIPISEMSFSRINKVTEAVEVGQLVDATILRVEMNKRRIALSMKQAQPDPWQEVLDSFTPNSKVKGTVTKTADFGAFVQLVPGVEGLVHISALADQHVRAVTDVVKAGQEVEVWVLGVDQEKRRISLSMTEPKDQSAADVEAAGNASAESAQTKRKKKKNLRGGLESFFDWGAV